MRHSFASWCAEAGANTIELAELLDHKTLTMVARYTHPAFETMKQATSKLEKYLSGEEKPSLFSEEDTSPEGASTQIH